MGDQLHEAAEGVREEKDLSTSIGRFLKAVADKITENVNDPAQLHALADELHADGEEFCDAIVENTVAD